MRSKIIYTILILNTFLCFGQGKVIVEGFISDTAKNPLFGGTIIAKKPNSNVILAYTMSNLQGLYKLELSNSLDSIVIKTSYIGFIPQLKTILNKTTSLSFLLIESATALKEIIVKSTPISKKGDTINYSVARFKTAKDRVIADVLKKMPGIEIQADGKILYQGKPIQKYYIEGLDLLEGKYNLANNNIPIDEVSKIQVLENHQPIQILDSLVFSENASLNIRLKNKKIFVTPASLGFGASPLLLEASATPMAFSKNNQFIGNIKANNAGVDITKELKVLTFEEFTEQKVLPTINWTQIVPLATPLSSKESWLDNTTQLTSFNYLKKLDKDYQLKISGSYVNDRQNRIGNTKTIFFANDDEIIVNERKENRLNIRELLTKITLEKNTKQKYFKNTFEFNSNWNSQFGGINTNEIVQDLAIPNTQINNSLKLILPYKRTLLTFNSKVFYNVKNENLNIKPGFFEELVNDGNNLESIAQDIKHNFLLIDNKIGFTKGISGFTVSPSLGLSYQNQNLESTILLNNANTVIQEDGFRNDLLFSNINFYLNTALQYEYDLFKFNVLLPLSVLKINATNNNNSLDRTLSKLVFNPKISVSRDVGDFWNLSGTTFYENRFGNINEIFSGFIINDYRNINSFDAPIRTDKVTSYRFRVGYRNILKGLFMNGFYSNTNTISNLILDYDYGNNGSLTLKAIENENSKRNQIIGIRTSKFFSKINTTLKINLSAMSQKRPNFINNQLQLIENNQNTLETAIDYDYSSWLNIAVKNILLKSNSFSNDSKIQELTRNTISSEINIYPSDNHLFQLSYENIAFKNKTTSYNSFLDASYSYNFPKSKSTIEFCYDNILNTKNFNSQFISEIIQTETTFIMRPAQLLVSYKFTF
ncbi:hypothetical protein K8354_18545 [Polaribacter litorisediminis]|uniref:hypothetical protein n=1 Tax=Polaribacter litorisediminis TaxID=1908341 RepID=UPI001CC0E881|nr:hypothetical protein [Polaribacter litorisediminis]UAM98245.1 hypothetical protein K8354_18545 [Polaribacter litorisediminis]